MEDAADLGLSAFEKGIDKYHDKVYDSVAAVPGKIPGRKHKHRHDHPAQAPYPEHDQGPDYNDAASVYEPTPVKDQYKYVPYQDSYRARNNNSAPMSRYDAEPNYYYGRQPDTYDPEIGRAQGVARDGYAADDAASAYTSRERRHKGPRYLEYGPDGSRYGQGGGAAYGSRSYDDLRSRRDRDYGSDSDEYEDDRQVAERRKSRHGSRKSSRHRRRSIEDDVESPRDVGQNDWKKWGATIAGAAVGAYGVHRGLKSSSKHGGGNEDYLGAAVGAVVGGLIAREAEKEFYKHKATKETNMVVDDNVGKKRDR